RLTLPFVFAGPPSAEELEAAGVVASWFGAMASYRGASFPVHVGELPAGHAVVFSTGGRLPGGLQVSSGGAQLSIIANPRGRAAKLLVISGGDGMGLNMAARALTLGSEALSGATTAIREFTEPAPREPYDAPRWIPTDRPVQLGELAQNWQLEASGLYPDLLRVPFHMPPDLFTWRGKGMKLDLKYRYTPTVGAKSTLNVNINNEFVEAIALSYTGEDKAAEDRINLPFVAQYEAINEATVYVPDYKFSADNTLQFQYYFERKKEGACKDVVLDNLRGVIDKDSTIDLTAFPHFAFLPDLSLFANGGFPFTRYADLSQTAIVLPDQVTAEEVEAYLTLMGRIGNATGYPAHRFLLTSAASVASAEDRDVLVIGAAGNQPLLEQWAAEMPMTVVDGATRLRVLGPIERLRARWEGRDVRGAQDHAGQVILQAGSSLGAIMSFASPLGGDRTAVVLTAGDAKRLVDVANLFTEPGKAQFIRGDLVLLNGNEINHYALGSQYSTGSLPLLLGLRWWFSQQPILLVAAGLLVALLVAIMGFRVLRTMGAARKAQS
ncbi:MAG TPA: cellulose biosynthesis cyclic di-GMP-binding regulatory protein BcsB, partial [Nevskiaceae bacterium]|nr:cellulose biosynthesis cyclic di-GMP-binding regulatory protein BcsB [Nevskiaceae bacterium]